MFQIEARGVLILESRGVGYDDTIPASNFGCSTDGAIFGFNSNVESESDERQVGGTSNDTCGDQKSGRTQGMYDLSPRFRTSLTRPFPSLDFSLSALVKATFEPLRGRFDILMHVVSRSALEGPMAANPEDRPGSLLVPTQCHH